jgi:hypothetical protein
MPSVSDALCLDVWRLRKDKCLEGGLFTYEAGDVTLRVRRHGQLLTVEFEGGKQEIALRTIGHRISMTCPRCYLGRTKLYTLEGLIKCKLCHDLKADTLTKISNSEGKIEALQVYINSFDMRLLLKERRMLYVTGSGMAIRTARERINSLNRKLAMERLALFRGCTE